MADEMSIDRKDPAKDDSDDSGMDSSPEVEAPPAQASSAQETQQPKRKGGRKPIYATSEERKQRNRQAQAAFRERRTEYIKQLEETIRSHEANLHSLQAAHRSAADECLMLRYKNSLLERILLEKGIDVQAELRAKSGSPNLGPTHMPQNLVQAPIQRVMIGRHQPRRSGSSLAAKIDSVVSPLPSVHPHSSAASPKSRPTPSSHTNSPTNPGSVFVGQSAMSPTASDPISMRSSIPPALKHQIAPVGPINPPRPQLVPPAPNRVPAGGPYYATPAFQTHYSELEQEYDAPEVLEDSEIDTPSGPGPYPTAFAASAPQPMTMSPTATGPGQPLSIAGEPVLPMQPTTAGFPSMTQLLDPTLDFDPFGLTASMAFPSQYSFDPNNSNNNMR